MKRRFRYLGVASAQCPVASPLAGQSAEPIIRPGDIVAANIADSSVSVFDGETGTFLGVFAQGAPLERPFSIVFGPGGNLFVSSMDVVLRYDRAGAFTGYAARDSSLSQPIGLAFGADSMLYVSNSGARNVSRFDPATGALGRVFATDSLMLPSDVVFGPDGDLYVSSAASYRVVRFDGRTGAFEEIVATLPNQGVPMGMAFRAERLVVGDFGRSRLFFLDAPTRVPSEVATEGLARPENIAIRPVGEPKPMTRRSPTGGNERTSV